MKPLAVIIRRPGRKGIGNESLLAGKRYDMECETTGSRPPAVITWYKGRRRQLKHTTVRERKIRKSNARAQRRSLLKYKLEVAAPYPSLSLSLVAYPCGVSRIFYLAASCTKATFSYFRSDLSLSFLFRHFRKTPRIHNRGLASG